jgi:TonB family protein
MRHLFICLFTFVALCGHAREQTNTVTIDSATGIYTHIRNMPHSGYDYNDYLAKHLRYPKDAIESDIQGKVVVRFVVNEDGSVSGCTVVKSAHKVLDDEALRVISSFPKWIPGTLDGKPVKVYFTMPISFMLDNVKRKKHRHSD